MPTVHLIHGFIGNGKTTFSRELEIVSGAVRLSPDEVMTARYGADPPASRFKRCLRAVMKALDRKWTRIIREGKSVILDYGFWTRKQRNRFRKMAANLGADTVLYDVRCGERTALRRVHARNRDTAGSLYISDNTFRILKKDFEPVRAGEKAVTIRTGGRRLR